LFDIRERFPQEFRQRILRRRAPIQLFSNH
jgi:hypothetical protein